MKNNKDEELEQILKESDALNQSTALNKIVLKLLKDTKAENFRLWLALLLLMIITTFIAIFMHLSNIEQQNNFVETQNKYLEYLNSFEYEIVEEIYEEGIIDDKESSEVIQENSNGNNVYQAGDNATYNQ